MDLPRARHDALFRLLVSDPARAGRLLRDYAALPRWSPASIRSALRSMSRGR
ncbi:MAG: hypothetical protein OXL68_13285 [Paracoccaceae bacterium]|nr:hypothetical protein [Paracoccaceae bacterium]